MIDNNQKNQQKEVNLGWLPRIVTIIFTAVVLIVGINYLAPRATVCRWGCDHGGPVSFSRETYHRATEEIRSLVAGENLDTSKLAHFLSIEVDPNPHRCSPLTIETCCSWWLNGCQVRLYRLLNLAYSNARTNHNMVARFYLSLADFVSSRSGCFDCNCEDWYCDDYVWEMTY